MSAPPYVRTAHESSSPFGQIVHDRLPRNFTAGDIDLYIVRFDGDTTLVRLIEHKQPNSKYGLAQQLALSTLHQIIRHAVDSTPSGMRLDKNSGVFVARGEANPETGELGDHDVMTPLGADHMLLTGDELLAWLPMMGRSG